MNRANLQHLSNERVEDARALLATSRWSGAYYLTGYALECALKSCILAHIERTGVIFEDKKFAEQCWTHDLELLTKKGGLDANFGVAMGANSQLELNWQVARGWTEASRYQINTQTAAEELFRAVIDVPDGVLTWVKNYW